MNDEEAFQSHLDAHPDDHTARLVFADWLQERDDPRAEGYRALGVLGRWPLIGQKTCGWTFEDNLHIHSGDQHFGYRKHSLPSDWYTALTGAKRGPIAVPPGWWLEPTWYERYKTRRAAEDAAALTFTLLPAERRAELLAGVPA